MSDLSSIVDPFHRGLYRVLIEKIDTRMVQLASGQAKDYAEYQHHAGYVQAMNDVLGICQQIEQDRYGPKPGQQNEQE